MSVRSASLSGPSLRIVAGPEDLATGPPTSTAITLSEFFADHFVPGRLERPGRPRSPETVAQYRETIRMWAAATGDPPLARCDEQVLAIFETWLAGRTWRGSPISAQTQAKHLRHCQAVLRYAGPRNDANRRAPRAEGFYGEDRDGRPRSTPYFELPEPTQEGPTGVLTLDEIDRWIELCEFARKPYVGRVSPTTWWRLLIVFLYNTGLRIETALAVRYDQIEDGWLRCEREQMKGRRHGHAVWLNHYAAAAVRELFTWREPPASATIFGWPFKLNWFQATRRRIVAPAGKALAKRLKPHGLRKAMLTHLTGENEAVARMVAGHRSGDVLLGHYAHARATQRLLDAAPQPAWAVNHFGRPDQVEPRWRQTELF